MNTSATYRATGLCTAGGTVDPPRPRAPVAALLAWLCTLGAAMAPDGRATAAETEETPPVHRTQRIEPSARSTAEIREEAASRPYPLDFGQRLDRAHDWIYVNAQELVESTDRRFAPPDAELLPVPATPFRVGLVTETLDRPDGVKFDLDMNLDVTLNLPNIERRLRIFITSDDVAESPAVAGEQGNLRAGLRFNPRSNFDFDIGLRGDLPPIAFASLRWSVFQPVGLWDLRPFAKLFAETDEGVGVSAGLTLDRRLGRSTIFRSSSFAKWRNDRDAIEWTQALFIARAGELLMPERYGQMVRNRDLARGYGLQLLASGARRDTVDYYEVAAFYKRPLRNRWLYGYIEPLLRWDRKYDWSTDPGIRIGFEALFWDLSRSRSGRATDPILLRPPEDRPAAPPDRATDPVPNLTRPAAPP
ncbi:MAG: hypothetical protein R3E75_04530 [Steroidobacteraceae bacterium]|nr:hypothetical protein [Nevskiaceae bacterium]MCP5339345.1 hypothetical protein [Nevskiaceae bacterium]MCP5466528.1 hypothetical protein [Nevskiaceae bacterium]MCP5471374.1 hypothetical protein [Nevskiaceae bacterium]